MYVFYNRKWRKNHSFRSGSTVKKHLEIADKKAEFANNTLLFRVGGVILLVNMHVPTEDKDGGCQGEIMCGIRTHL